MEKGKLEELFESMDKEVFTEEIQLKIGTLFESMVAEAVAAKEQQLEEQNEKDLEGYKAQLVENVDQYLDYFSESYMKENEIIVEDFTKVKLAEKILRNFKQMCEAFNISLSEEVVSSEDEIEGLKEDINKVTNDLMESRKELELVKKSAIIAESFKGCTDIQREKLIEAAKSVDFESTESFKEKVNSLIEKILKEEVTEEDAPAKLDEQVEDQQVVKPTSEAMKSYLKYLKK